MAQKFKYSVEKKNSLDESDNKKINNKVNFLHHILLIANWIQNFDSKNVNDCFDKTQNRMPPQFRQYDKQVNDDLKSIDRLKLSPNNAGLNDFLKSQSFSIASN